MKMSAASGKAPHKLHLTMPPSAHNEKSTNELHNLLESKSTSQGDLDLHPTDQSN